eukprot:Sdes_comp22024_c0_seq1m20560
MSLDKDKDALLKVEGDSTNGNSFSALDSFVFQEFDSNSPNPHYSDVSGKIGLESNSNMPQVSGKMTPQNFSTRSTSYGFEEPASSQSAQRQFSGNGEPGTSSPALWTLQYYQHYFNIST